jgi:homoserine O-succinyltransferase
MHCRIFLDEDALVACGYRVLTRSEDAGIDAFVKQTNSLFVFFQGHPEYETDTLLREYRRDVRRFLILERETYPPMPQGYFSEQTVDRLIAMRERASSNRREELLAGFPDAREAGNVTNTWHPAAAGIYRNWLLYMRAQKEQRLRR